MNQPNFNYLNISNKYLINNMDMAFLNEIHYMLMRNSVMLNINNNIPELIEDEITCFSNDDMEQFIISD